MKKFLLVFYIGFILTSNINGQTKQDSINAYDKVKEWAVVKLTIAYMEDFKGWPLNDINFNESDKLEFGSYNDLKRKFDSYDENVDLDGFRVGLSNGWSKTRDAVYEKYRTELIDNNDINNFENIEFIPEKTKGTENRSKAIEIIVEKYNSFLPKIAMEDSDSELKQKDAGDQIAQSDLSLTTNDIDGRESKKGDFILYLLLVLSVLTNIFLIMKSRKNIRKKGKGNFKNVNNDGLEKLNISLQAKIKSLNDKIEIIENENSKLKNELNLRDKSNIQTQTEKISEDPKAVIVEFDLRKAQASTKKTYYFPLPFETKRFAKEEVSEEKKQTSLYVAEIDKNLNRGFIRLIETADLSRALNSPNTFLERVCDYENGYNPLARGIKVVEEGEVVLEREDWVVVRKIRIKFI